MFNIKYILEILDVFQQQILVEFQKSIRKAVERSHHRSKQKMYLKKQK